MMVTKVKRGGKFCKFKRSCRKNRPHVVKKCDHHEDISYKYKFYNTSKLRKQKNVDYYLKNIKN